MKQMKAVIAQGGGRVVMANVPMPKPTDYQCLCKIDACATCSGTDLAETTTAIRERVLQVAPTITHRFEAQDALKGFEMLHTGKPFNMGIVFRWDERVKDSAAPVSMTKLKSAASKEYGSVPSR
jgi:threonine dehydrogenase-like Zn-dependent dehydrogenase